jgi:hypothetical protein
MKFADKAVVRITNVMQRSKPVTINTFRGILSTKVVAKRLDTKEVIRNPA